MAFVNVDNPSSVWQVQIFLMKVPALPHQWQFQDQLLYHFYHIDFDALRI
jgi:hypothetical protein